jgi:hypothetical protein
MLIKMIKVISMLYKINYNSLKKDNSNKKFNEHCTDCNVT